MKDNWDFTKINVKELLPQAEPFVFVNQLEYFDDNTMSCETKFTIQPTCLLYNAKANSEALLLENIAQTCAVHIGFYNKYILKREIQVGFIGAVKNLQIFNPVEVGMTLQTKIIIKTEFGSMKIADATIHAEGKIIAEGELKIALQD